MVEYGICNWRLTDGIDRDKNAGKKYRERMFFTMLGINF